MVTPLRKHVSGLIVEDGLNGMLETPDEYAERLEEEQMAEEELMGRLKAEEAEAMHKEEEELRAVEEAEALREAEEAAEVMRIAVEEAQAAAAGIMGSFSSTTYQTRYVSRPKDDGPSTER